MKQLDPLVFISVFQEMLGLLFWPLAAFIVIGAFALLAILVRDQGIQSRRLVASEIVGFLGDRHHRGHGARDREPGRRRRPCWP